MKKVMTIMVLMLFISVSTLDARQTRNKPGIFRGPGDPLVRCNIELTDDQLATISSLRETAMAEIEAAETCEAIRAIIKKLASDIKAVLTEDQLAQLEECKANRERKNGGFLGKLGLTDEQKDQIKTIRSETRELLRDAETTEEKKAIIAGMYDRIKTEVLTEEQLEILAEIEETRALLKEKQQQRIQAIKAKCAKGEKKGDGPKRPRFHKRGGRR